MAQTFLERLSSSRQELPVGMIILLEYWLNTTIAHRNAGQVAQTNFFEVMFRVSIDLRSRRAQKKLRHPYRGNTPYSTIPYTINSMETQ